MSRLKKWDPFILAMLPIAFVGSGFLNAITYPIGIHRYDTVRTLLTFGIIGLVALLLFIKVICIWIERPEERKTILLAALIPVAFAVIHLGAIVLHPGSGVIWKNTFVNGCYLLSACCAVLIIRSEKKLSLFLRYVRIYGLILAPVMLYYCVRFYLPGATYGVENLGALGYMPLAYTCLHFCIALTLEDFLYGSELRYPQINYALCMLFSAAVALSGTKGTILCLSFFCVCMVVFVGKQTKRKFKIHMLPSTMLCSMVLFSTLLFPSYGAENRMLVFLKETFLPQHSVEISVDDIQETIGNLPPEQPVDPAPVDPAPVDPAPVDPAPVDPAPVDPAPVEPEPVDPAPDTPTMSVSEIIELVASGTAQQMLEAGEITQEEYDRMVAIEQQLNHTATGARKYLWMSAIQEIRNHPLTGQGIYFYQQKYGTYPHNFFLELATDFGVPVMVGIFLLGAYTFFRLFRKGQKNRFYLAFLLYVIAFLPQKLVSGYVYEDTTFLQYGFCLILAFLPDCVSLNMEDCEQILEGK